MDIGDDPGFLKGIQAVNAHDYYDASEEFEDLFFEAVLGEVAFGRVFLQVAVGAHHLERGQRQAAVDRLAEGLKAIDVGTNDRGGDLLRLGGEVWCLIARGFGGGPLVLAGGFWGCVFWWGCCLCFYL